MTLSQWADENYYLSAESSSIVGAWETMPYQKAIMNAISNDDIQIISWRKSARVGYTKIICAAIGYFAEHKKRNQLIYQPTDSDAKDFVKDEIDPMLRDVPAVKNILKTDPNKKSADNTLQKKGFIGSILDIRGGNSPRNFRRMTKDIVYYDELDGFDPDIGKEGSSTKLGDKRIETSSFPKSIRGSTPKTAGFSQIQDSFDDADMTFTRHLPCPDCNNYAPLEWHNMKWVDDDYRTAKIVCGSCGVLIPYSKYAKMDKIGKWKSESGDWIDDDTGFFMDSNDNIIDPPVHIGFSIWSAYSYFKVWQKTVSDFLSANKKAKKGDITDLKTFVNTSLGEAWEERGEKADDSALYKRREHYDKVPNDVIILTAFIDVQDDRLECGVTGWCVDEESYEIDYFRLYGNLSISQIWANLALKIRNNYTKEDNSILNIALTGIDSGGHYTDEAYEFSRKLGIKKVIPTKGYSEYGKPVANFPRKKNAKGVYLTMIGTDTAKELVYSRYEITEPGGGYCHHPIRDNFDEDYFKQATAEEKVLKYKKGVKYFVWDAKKRRNEVLDIKVGNLAMIRILQQHFGLLLKNKQVKKEVVKKKAARKRNNFVNRYRR